MVILSFTMICDLKIFMQVYNLKISLFYKVTTIIHTT